MEGSAVEREVPAVAVEASVAEAGALGAAVCAATSPALHTNATLNMELRARSGIQEVGCFITYPYTYTLYTLAQHYATLDFGAAPSMHKTILPLDPIYPGD